MIMIVVFSIAALILLTLVIYEYFLRDILSIVIETNDYLDEFESRTENKDKP